MYMCLDFKFYGSSTCFEMEDDLKLMISLPLPPTCWGYRLVLPYKAYTVFGTQSKASCMVGRQSELQPQISFIFLMIKGNIQEYNAQNFIPKTTSKEALEKLMELIIYECC